ASAAAAGAAAALAAAAARAGTGSASSHSAAAAGAAAAISAARGSSAAKAAATIAPAARSLCASVIAFARLHLATEQPVHQHGVGERERQEHQGAEQHEDLARRHGRGLPDRDRGRHEVGKPGDHETEIAEQKHRYRRDERTHLAAALE